MDLIEFTKKIGVHGFLHCNEMDKLFHLGANKECLEIGSYKGLSAYAIALGCRHLLCVDTFMAGDDGQKQEVNFTTLTSFKSAINRFNNVEHLKKTSYEASLIVKQTFDFIFIDAMHSYEEVKRDIEIWFPKLRKGGTIAFHDYLNPAYPGVKQAVDEYFGKELENVEMGLAWIEK